MSEIIPFTTQDKKLAMALALAGCSFLPCEHGGPATNTYTPQWLRNRRNPITGHAFLPVDGVTPEEVEKMAEICVEKRIPGIVDYHFVQDAIFQRAIKAWDDMVKEMNRANIEAEAHFVEFGKKQEMTPAIPDISETIVMQVCYLQRCGQKEFEKAPFIKPAEIAIGCAVETNESLPNRGPRVSDHSEAPAPRRKIKGVGYRRWTLGCRKELRDEVLKGLI